MYLQDISAYRQRARSLFFFLFFCVSWVKGRTTYRTDIVCVFISLQYRVVHTHAHTYIYGYIVYIFFLQSINKRIGGGHRAYHSSNMARVKKNVQEKERGYVCVCKKDRVSKRRGGRLCMISGSGCFFFLKMILCMRAFGMNALYKIMVYTYMHFLFTRCLFCL